jgi:hypothetical protein
MIGEMIKNSILKNNRHYLFTTYYQPNSEERKAEYDFCIEKNKVASIDRIYLFVEEQDVEAACKFGVEVVVTSKRPTFKDFFDYIRTEEIIKVNFNKIHSNALE